MIHVTMLIASRRPVEEVRGNEKIKGMIDATFKEIMPSIEGGQELARRLSLPSEAHIQWSVEIAALKGLTLEGYEDQDQHIPIMVSVSNVPDMMEKLRPEMVEEVTNMMFRQIRKAPDVSRELASALGYEVDKPAKFHIYLPHQVRVREMAGQTFDDDGGVSAWLEGGWSKSCSSWPW